MSAEGHGYESRSGQLHTLGVCWLAYGVIRLIVVFFLFAYATTATLMFGVLLNRVPNPFAMMDIFHFLYTAMIVLSAISGVLGLLAGVALLAGQHSGRTLALIAGFLSLSDIPLGITLGIYTLIELLPLGSTQLHGRSGEISEAGFATRQGAH